MTSVLEAAVVVSNARLVDFLLEQEKIIGPKKASYKHKKNALIIAAEYCNNPEIMNAIIASDPRVKKSIQRDKNQTLLQLANENGQMAIVKYLQKFSANAPKNTQWNFFSAKKDHAPVEPQENPVDTSSIQQQA